MQVFHWFELEWALFASEHELAEYPDDISEIDDFRLIVDVHKLNMRQTGVQIG